MKKFRSLRSSLSAKIKIAVFQVFAELPPPPSKAKAASIYQWKKSEAVAACYKKLFYKSNDDDDDDDDNDDDDDENTPTNMDNIIQCVWPKNKMVTDSQMAWAIAVTQLILNPNNGYVKVSEEAIRPLYIKNLVSNFFNIKISHKSIKLNKKK
jgi:hypothetical protein